MLDRHHELEGLAGVGNRSDPVPHGEHESAAAPGDDGTDLLACRKRAGGPQRRVITEDRARAHVDEQQRLALLVPMRALTHVGMHLGDDLDLDPGKAGHVAPLSG